MPDSRHQRAFALMSDWIVQDLSEGAKFENLVFEPCDVLTQSYHWEAFEALANAGILEEIETQRQIKFLPKIARHQVIPFSEGLQLTDDSFTEIMCAFLGCGDLNSLVASDPKEAFLVDKKSAPIFEALIDLDMVKRDDKQYFWTEQARKYMSRLFLWSDENWREAYESFKQNISMEAKTVLEQLADKYRSERPAMVSKTLKEKIFFLVKGARLLPRSDHGILTRTERDPVIPERFIPDTNVIRNGFLTSDCMDDDFMYFGQNTAISILKWQAMLVLMQDVGDWVTTFAKTYLEQTYPNPWGVVREIKTWVY